MILGRIVSATLNATGERDGRDESEGNLRQAFKRMGIRAQGAMGVMILERLLFENPRSRPRAS
jgi:hypothetical protein